MFLHIYKIKGEIFMKKVWFVIFIVCFFTTTGYAFAENSSYINTRAGFEKVRTARTINANVIFVNETHFE
jgi:hypothetical protein